MTIICAVAADFVNSDGQKFSVSGKELGIIKEAPEWIKDTLMFKWLANDGSIKFVTRDNRISVENDPMAGLNAEGKEVHTKAETKENGAVSEEPEASGTKKKTATKKATTKKKDDAE